MAKYCPNCGEELPPASTTCSECGERIPDDQGASTTRGDAGQQGAQGSRRRDDEWGATQGTEQQPGGGGQVPRKGAVDTFIQGFNWFITEPSLIGAFVVGALISSGLQIAIPTLSFAGFIVNLVVGGLAYVAAKRKLEGAPFDISAAFDIVINQIVPLIVVSLVYGIGVFVGTLLLIVPGIYIGGRLSPAPAACILNEQGFSESLSEGWEIGGNNLGKLVGLFVINFAFAFVLGFAAVAVLGTATAQSPVFILVSGLIAVPISGAYTLAIGRVYLENRGLRGSQV
jgi:hypothetical protein